MDWEPAIAEYDVASAVLYGITSDSNIVEKVARFIRYNVPSLKSLGMDADVSGNRIQEIWLNSTIVRSEEDLHQPAAKFIAVFQSLPEESEVTCSKSLSRTSLALEKINPVLWQVILSFAAGNSPLDLIVGDNSPMSRDWYNCVFNPGYSKEVPVALEVDVSRYDIRQHFIDVAY